MLRSDDIMATLRMFQEEHLDVRTVTLGISLLDCSDPDVARQCSKIALKIRSRAGDLVRVCDEVSTRYGIPIVNKRLAVSPVSALAACGGGEEAFLRVARVLDDASGAVGVDLVGGFTALVQKGMTAAERALIQAIPRALSQTERVCASVNVASTAAGINMDAVNLVAARIRDLAHRTADRDGFGAAKLVVFANAPEDNPFMAGAYLGHGEPDTVVNIGVSGPGVVKQAVERLCGAGPADLGDIAEEIKKTAFRVTRVGELIGREVAARLNVKFGIVDLSLAPTPRVGDSVGEILQAMGVARIGAPGSTAALAMLNDAVKKGGLFASSSVGGLSGAFIPVCEDAALSRAATEGDLTLAKLEVCSVGLDMIAIPGDTDAATIAALIADEASIGVVNRKTTAARIIPVPGKKAGDVAVFGGLFGRGGVIAVQGVGAAAEFVRRGGRIPAPLGSLNN